MARKTLVGTDDLLDRLGATFRDVGYDGASLALLSEATGLKKASLYPRYPGGKEQMGLEVLREAGRWLTAHVLEPLAGAGSPRERIAAMAHELDCFYRGGEQPCLLNMLSAPIGGSGPFKAEIRQMFEVLIDALAGVIAETGCPADVAHDRAERGVALIQGSLVLVRGLGSTALFRKVLTTLPDELLGDEGDRV